MIDASTATVRKFSRVYTRHFAHICSNESERCPSKFSPYHSSHLATIHTPVHPFQRRIAGEQREGTVQQGAKDGRWHFSQSSHTSLATGRTKERTAATSGSAFSDHQGTLGVLDMETASAQRAHRHATLHKPAQIDQEGARPGLVSMASPNAEHCHAAAAVPRHRRNPGLVSMTGRLTNDIRQMVHSGRELGAKLELHRRSTHPH